MQTGKKRLAVKSGIVFLAVMIFFTFFSRTILYFTTPKVITASPESGYIKNTYSFNSIEFYYDNVVEVKLPIKLKQPFTVQKLATAAGSEVKAGDELVIFDTSTYDDTIKNLQTQIDSARIEYQQFSRDYGERLSQLQKDHKEYTAQLQKLDYSITNSIYPGPYEQALKERKDLEAKISKAAADLEYFQTSGILNGKTLETINRKLQDAENELQKTRNIVEAYCVLRSPVEGRISKMSVKEQDKCDGSSVLMSIIPSTSDVKLLAKLSEKQRELFKPGMACSILYGNKQAKGKTLEVMKQGELVYLAVEPDKNAGIDFVDAKEAKVSIETKSEYFNVIIPNSAFCESEYVYILKTRQGWWGLEQYVIKQQVSKGEYNERQAQVKSGISKNDKVVTGWDRALTDGARVMLPLK